MTKRNDGVEPNRLPPREEYDRTADGRPIPHRAPKSTYERMLADPPTLVSPGFGDRLRAVAIDALAVAEYALEQAPHIAARFAYQAHRYARAARALADEHDDEVT